jgi:hypothetical protein
MPDGVDEKIFKSMEKLVETLSTSVDTLSTAVEKLTKRQRAQLDRLSRTLVMVIIGLILDSVLTIGGVGLWLMADSNSDRIAETQRATDRHLCAMYDLFLDSYNRASPSAKVDPKSYEESFKRLEADAADANCAHRIRGRN